MEESCQTCWEKDAEAEVSRKENQRPKTRFVDVVAGRNCRDEERLSTVVTSHGSS